MIELKLNGASLSLDVDPDMPLLWAIREVAALTGTKFGCGMAQCGACTVHLDGVPTRSCITAVGDVGGHGDHHHRRASAGKVAETVQTAWVKMDVPQCGYCQSGQVMSAVALLTEKKKPSDADIDDGHERQSLPLRDLSPHPWRHPRSRQAVWRPEHAPRTIPHCLRDLDAVAPPLPDRRRRHRRPASSSAITCCGRRRRRYRAPRPVNPFAGYVQIGADNKVTVFPPRWTWAKAPTTASPRWSPRNSDADWAQIDVIGGCGQLAALRQPDLGRRRPGHRRLLLHGLVVGALPHGRRRRARHAGGGRGAGVERAGRRDHGRQGHR